MDIAKNNIIALIILALLALAIPVSLYLAQQQQIFAPRAAESCPNSQPVVCQGERNDDDDGRYQVNPDPNNNCQAVCPTGHPQIGTSAPSAPSSGGSSSGGGSTTGGSSGSQGNTGSSQGAALTGRISGISPDPVRKISGSWERVTINVTANNANWKLLFRTAAGSCASAASCSLEGWFTIASGSGDKSNITFNAASSVVAGPHEFALFDGSATLVWLYLVNFEDTGGSTIVTAEGSSCSYKILNNLGADVTSGPIYENENYTFRVTMTNKGDSNWSKSTHKLKAVDNTLANWETAPEHALSLDSVSKDDGQAIFNIPAKAKPLATGENFNDARGFSYTMTRSGQAFGATCSPQIIRVQKKSAAAQNTRCYVLSQNKSERDSVKSCSDSKAKPFIRQGMEDTINLTGTATGTRTIFVRFFGATDADKLDFEKTVQFSPTPGITNLECSQSATGTGVALTVTGVAFGTSQDGSILKTRDGKTPEITSWTDTKISALLEDARLEGNISVDLKNSEGKGDSETCTVGVTTIRATARLQCRDAGKYALDNVDMKLYLSGEGVTNTQPLLSQKSRIDKDGNVLNFSPKVERNKDYSLIIKGPGTLAKKIDFKATGGTKDLDPVILPFGDIAPTGAPDGKVNALDKSEMIKQWSLIKDVVKSADADGNGRVNAIDWSCIRVNTNKEDERFSVSSTQSSLAQTVLTLTADTRGPISNQKVIYSGTLQDSEGDPIPGKVIKLFNASTESLLKDSSSDADGSHHTDSAGKFAIVHQVPSNSQFRVFAKFDGDSLFRQSQSSTLTITPSTSSSDDGNE